MPVNDDIVNIVSMSRVGNVVATCGRGLVDKGLFWTLLYANWKGFLFVWDC